YQSALFDTPAPASLGAEPGLVWGVADEHILALDPATGAALAFLGIDRPAALAHVEHFGSTYTVWYSDWAQRSIVRLSYTYPGGPRASRMAWLLPELRVASSLVYVPPPAGPDLPNPPAATTLWYLDRANNRLGRLMPYATPPYVEEYDLPALGAGELSYAPGDRRLWFTLVDAVAAFDPATGLLTRYEAAALPVLGLGGAAGWMAHGEQAFQIRHRHLLFFPDVRLGILPEEGRHDHP
ncbi:MAG: hypothetical protein KKA73_13205, partial [Chloroflexi bacterium]|nr:hypothetical protein [Chloroflexota bacterium]